MRSTECISMTVMELFRGHFERVLAQEGRPIGSPGVEMCNLSLPSCWSGSQGAWCPLPTLRGHDSWGGRQQLLQRMVSCLGVAAGVQGPAPAARLRPQLGPDWAQGREPPGPHLPLHAGPCMGQRRGSYQCPGGEADPRIQAAGREEVSGRAATPGPGPGCLARGVRVRHCPAESLQLQRWGSDRGCWRFPAPDPALSLAHPFPSRRPTRSVRSRSPLPSLPPPLAPGSGPLGLAVPRAAPPRPAPLSSPAPRPALPRPATSPFPGRPRPIPGLAPPRALAVPGQAPPLPFGRPRPAPAPSPRPRHSRTGPAPPLGRPRPAVSQSRAGPAPCFRWRRQWRRRASAIEPDPTFLGAR